MLKKQDKVIFHNRGINEYGTILRKWRRKEVVYFNVLTERGVVLENMTTDSTSPCYILQDLSLKLKEK